MKIKIEKNTIRYNYIYMTKGLLISFVVLGHMLSDCFLNKVIFWFHVPAFFILSGVFLKDENVNLKKEFYKNGRLECFLYRIW